MKFYGGYCVLLLPSAAAQACLLDAWNETSLLYMSAEVTAVVILYSSSLP